MAKDRERQVISKNPKWVKESEKIRTVQLAFDFGRDVDTALRLIAARRHVSPSAIIRERLGLPIAAPSRKRISVSVNENELAELGNRYKIDPKDRAQIKKRISDLITAELESDDDINHVQIELERAHMKLASVKKESARIAASLQGLFNKEGKGE